MGLWFLDGDYVVTTSSLVIPSASFRAFRFPCYTSLINVSKSVERVFKGRFRGAIELYWAMSSRAGRLSAEVIEGERKVDLKCYEAMSIV